MFRFEQIEYLYLILLLPVLAVLFYLLVRHKQSTLKKLGQYNLISKLFPDWSITKEWIKTILFLIGLGFCFVALANPQWGARKQKIKAKSTDVIIALDISQSMMAEDLSPNRLERAKRFTTSLINSLKGERIGLIYFAGSAYLQMPLTNDYAAAEIYTKSANTAQAGTQGTAIAEAIDLAMVTFGEDNGTQKAIIIISDGENHDQEAIDAATTAQEKGAFVYTIGVGTEDGAMIPFINQKGGKEFKKDKSGNPVRSSLNVGLLQDIATTSGGEFYLMEQSPRLLSEIKNEINKLEKKEVEQRSFTDFASYFQYFLFFGLLFLIIEYFVSNTINKNWNLKKHLNI